MSDTLPTDNVKTQIIDKFEINRLVIDVDDGNSISILVSYGYLDNGVFVETSKERITGIDIAAFAQQAVDGKKNLGQNLRIAIRKEVINHLVR